MAVQNSSTAQVNSSTGVLTKFIAQTSDISPELTNGNILRWNEKYKGPYDTCKDLIKELSRGAKRSTVITSPSQYFDSIFDAPQTPGSKEWRLDSARVTQGTAGEHATLTFFWYCDPNIDADEDTIVSWQLAYGQDSVNVLAYCTNKLPPDNSPSLYLSGESYQSRIQSWWNQSQDTACYQPTYKFVSSLGANKIEELGKAEQAIAKKYQAGMNPLRHYPIITKTTTHLSSQLDNFEIEDLDVIDTPAHSPFVLTGWEWLKVGMNYSYNSRDNATTVTETWYGAAADPGWDKDFYSADSHVRWKFGKVNDSALSGH